MNTMMIKKALTVVTMIVALAATSWGHYWDGSENDGLWNTPLNWDEGSVPTGSIFIENGDSVLLDTPQSAGEMEVNNANTTLTIKSALDTGGDSEIRNGGTIIIGTGGSWVLDDDMKMDTGVATLIVTDGSFETGLSTSQDGYLNMTDSASRLEISGGSFIVEDKTTINGTLQVIGDTATRISLCDNGEDSVWLNKVELVLKDGGITTIEAGASIGLGALLDVTLDPSFTPAAGDYDLIVAATRSGTFATTNLPSTDWSLSYVTDTTEIVRLTYSGSAPAGTVIMVR